MKFIAFVLITSFLSPSFSLTKQEFLKLSDEQKIEFIRNQTIEIEEIDQIKKFLKDNENFLKLILEAGERSANSWQDTILEGPYALTEKTETEVTTLYTYNDEVYAIHAVVSASAILTDSCEFNEQTNDWGDDCSEGSISEPIFVDAAGHFIESEYYVEFND